MEHNKELLNLILDRRSCRRFLPQLPDRPTLAAIAEAGRYAPSARNQQACRFYIITDRPLLERMAAVVSARLEDYRDRDCTYGAPALILVTNRRENNCALQDASCAMENMMLAAHAMGLASCWINQPWHLDGDPELRALLAPFGLEEGESICCSLALGLPDGPLPSGRKERTGNQVVWVGPAE